MDRVPAHVRSLNMSRIGQKNTKPELAVRRTLHRLGLRYRLHKNDLPGRPDIVFPSQRLAIFVHGCFWHRHEGCKLATTPKTNTDFWLQKFDTNVRRDADTQVSLEQLGWNSFVVWECETRRLETLELVCHKVYELIRGGSSVTCSGSVFPTIPAEMVDR